MRRARLKPGKTILLAFSMTPIIGAQGLPWESQSLNPPWLVVNPMPESGRVIIKQQNADLTVRVDRDGTIVIVNQKGIKHLRLGLPGRPVSIWRDAGQPLDSVGWFPFPSHTPLSTSFNRISKETSDFLNNLAGLLWIFDDSEEYLTIVHPATFQHAFLSLPSGKDLELRFHPDCLELYKRGPRDSNSVSNSVSWAISWKDLVPIFHELAKPSVTLPRGTALAPYPQK